jgi:hypothetical protein
MTATSAVCACNKIETSTVVDLVVVVAFRILHVNSGRVYNMKQLFSNCEIVTVFIGNLKSEVVCNMLCIK